VARHRSVNPFADPGKADLTAHVAFGPLARAAHPARASALVPQGVFLERLGITARAQALAKKLRGPALDRHIAAHRRLTHPDEMGHLFKVRALFPDAWPRRRGSKPDAEEARPKPMPAVTASLEIITSPLLGDVRHGFFTRRGGASSGIFEGLNCGGGSSDQSAIVAMNRTAWRAHGCSGRPAGHRPPGAYRARRHAVGPDDGADHRRRHRHRDPGLAIAILTADCQPVLFRDSRAGVVAAAHAGWRGALDGDSRCHARRNGGRRRAAEDVHAVIGPAISQRAYEVGASFSNASWTTTLKTRGSSSTGRMANTCSICRATA
jgi:hypothetical protein